MWASLILIIPALPGADFCVSQGNPGQFVLVTSYPALTLHGVLSLRCPSEPGGVLSVSLKSQAAFRSPGLCSRVPSPPPPTSVSLGGQQCEVRRGLLAGVGPVPRKEWVSSLWVLTLPSNRPGSQGPRETFA